MAEMSAEKVDDMLMFCASCGIAETDDIKLKKCNACKSVRYCGVKCQREHRRQHKNDCKKRAAELRDEILFEQPESSYLGECPICCLPLSIDPEYSTIMMCCSKKICNGCFHANEIREMKASLIPSCSFCRQPVQAGDKLEKQRMTRIEANDPAAMSQKGIELDKKGDYQSALTYFTKAAGLGDAEAHYWLSHLYSDGLGVEKDSRKEIHHLEEAAIGGHPEARFNLACSENKNGNIERAVKHWIIAANLGHDLSIKALMRMFKGGFVEKEVLDAALRAHQAAVDATESPLRDVAEEYYRLRDGLFSSN